WLSCLVRTDPAAKKHDGLGFLLIDMTTPGVTVRPIRLISGASPFCETFFDQARVPAKNLVGAPGQGWTVAKAVLGHERALISKMRDSAAATDEPLEAIARRTLGGVVGQPLPDPALRDRIAQANIDTLAGRLLIRRTQEAIEAGRAPGPESSLLKLCGTELSKRRREIEISIPG